MAGETIFLVDDNESVLDMACDILSQYGGYTTISAESGEEAVKIYEEKKDQIDLVIMDVEMPGMGGYECLCELMKIKPETKIIMSTGYSADEKVQKALEAGAADYIGKPYRLIDMVEKVREVLDSRQAE